MKKMKVINTIFILIFLVIIILPLTLVNKNSTKLSETENRYLTPFPQIYDAQGKLMPDLKAKFENWFNDNVGFRDELVKLNANVLYKLFKTSPNERVHIGRDEWFFYTQDDNLKIGQGTYELTQEILENIKKEQEFIQKELAKKGIEYILVLTPSKASVYPEKIRGGNYSVTKTPIDIVTDYLRENTTIKVINTKEQLLKVKNQTQVFYKTDTHWNEQGGYQAYQQLVDVMQDMDLIDEEVVGTYVTNGTYKGEFSALMGNVELLEEESTEIVNIQGPKAKQIERIDLDNLAQQLYQGGDNHIVGGNSYFVNSTQGKKALIYGDSFFGNRKILSLLAEHFNELNFVWSDKIMSQMVENTKPDVVIFERTERYLYTLAKKADQRLAHPTLITHDSQIISHNTPQIIKRDEKYNINITVKNTSQDTWSENKQVRLCIWQDGQDYGYRVNIPDGIEVRPNEEITFTLQGFGAPPNSTTYLEYQMVEEGITYFGERERVDIVVEN